MSIPDFQSIMLPFLQVLSDGQERSMKEMVDSLAQRFSLTDTELEELLPSGQQTIFSNRVAWTTSHLKNAGVVDNPSRGRVRLSSDGARVLSEVPVRIDIRYLRQFESYRTFTGQDKVASDPETLSCCFIQSSRQSIEEFKKHVLRTPSLHPQFSEMGDRYGSMFFSGCMLSTDEDDVKHERFLYHGYSVLEL